MHVVSFSLWGNSQKYWRGAVKNIELVQKQYPTFVPRFYVDSKCDPSLIKTLDQDNVEVIIVEESGDQTGMFWRFYASADDNVDIALIRDCDSVITDR